ncbi:MAG: Ig-like domain-containing protein, partial [Gammaproteobacteria bacterium]|nr:Ig-like domain-containing protein [Gammaproteobacteria bacterium]
LTGQPGSVEAFTEVTLTNTRTGESLTVQADETGAFTATLDAATNDELILTVTDAAGNTSDSLTLTVTGPTLSITITEPIDGTAVPYNQITVKGTHNGDLNTGITVNGIPALVSPDGDFEAANIPLTAGDNTLKVAAANLAGENATVQITVIGADHPPAVTLNTDITNGPGPLTVRFNVTTHTEAELIRIDYDFDNDGVVDATAGDTNADVEHTYTDIGFHYPQVTVITNNDTHQAQTTVLVLDEAQMDVMFKQMWNGMNDRLIQGEVEAALRYMSNTAKRKYRPIYEEILDIVVEGISSYSAPVKTTIHNDWAEYAISRSQGGQQYVFFVYFMKDANGTWKLHSM